jgi:hypothetical protein
MKLRLILLIGILLVGFSPGCKLDRPPRLALPVISALGLKTEQSLIDSVSSPLIDSLVGVFKGMTVAIKHRRPDVFLAFLDPEEEGKLQVLSVGYGYESLTTYLMNHANYWPDPDTLIVFDIRRLGDLARLAFAGPGERSPRYGRQRRYTFVLYRLTEHGWKMAAISALEKPERDLYGYPVAYDDMELPSKLRFPRFF